jgi:hypothetical protein
MDALGIHHPRLKLNSLVKKGHTVYLKHLHEVRLASSTPATKLSHLRQVKTIIKDLITIPSEKYFFIESSDKKKVE